MSEREAVLDTVLRDIYTPAACRGVKFSRVGHKGIYARRGGLAAGYLLPDDLPEEPKSFVHLLEGVVHTLIGMLERQRIDVYLGLSE